MDDKALAGPAWRGPGGSAEDHPAMASAPRAYRKTVCARWTPPSVRPDLICGIDSGGKERSDTPVTFRFDEIFRRQLGDLCAGFCRVPVRSPVDELKRAAVAITVVENNDDISASAFLLTLRAADLRTHSSQWALPGGRSDPGETPVVTALRELHEELGLRLKAEHVLGILDDYPTRSGYLVTPVVLWGGEGIELHPNHMEIASVHRIPLQEILSSNSIDFVTIPESDRQLVRIRIKGNLIYAPTAAILYQFRELLAGRYTRVAEFEQPVFAWR